MLNKSFLQILSRARKYLFPYITLNILFNILQIIFSVASIPLLIQFLEIIFLPEKNNIDEAPIFNYNLSYPFLYFKYYFGNLAKNYGSEKALLSLCIFIVSVFLLKNIFRYLAVYFLVPFRNGLIRDLRNELFSKIIELPLAFHDKKKKGELITRATNDMDNIENSVIQMLEMIITEPLTIIAYFCTMLFISVKLTLFIFLLLPITVFIIGYIGRKLKTTAQGGQQKLGEIVSSLDESVSGLRVVKSFGGEQNVLNIFREKNEFYYKTMNRMWRIYFSSSPVTEFLGMMVVAAVLYYGGNLVLNANINLPPANFIAFIIAFASILQPAKVFANAYYNIQKGIVSSERIMEIINAKNEISDIANPVFKKSFNNTIEFKNVNYKYDDEYVLKNISFTIQKGKSIALVGQSGAGKSTIADLIPRFYDIHEGEILIDGINIKNISRDDLRNLISIVTQEPILFNESVANNINFEQKQTTQSVIQHAAEVANAHKFIEQLPEKYNTIIGDRGNLLSGGQKQRLTIARAVFKNAPILIMDEATSALDTESEKLVQQALDNVLKNNTSIIIAHRLSTIQHVDEILVLEKGEIIERGNHKTLMNQNGLYQKLVSLQKL